MRSVSEVRTNEEGIAYMKVYQFGKETAREFAETMDVLEQSSVTGLIIDLRDNPGGLLLSARAVAAEFFPQGALVLYTEGRSEASRETFLSCTPARRDDYPIVILVNGGSASGSEIVAAALQDSGRAYIVGERTRGKGSVQRVYQLERGDGFRQTTALYYTASGRAVERTGLEPDQIVEIPQSDVIRLEIQRRHESLFTAEEFESHFGFAPDIQDPQLQAAYEAIRSGAAAPEPKSSN